MASPLDRAALSDAIRDRAWRVVEIMQEQIDKQVHAAADNVVPLRRREQA